MQRSVLHDLDKTLVAEMPRARKRAVSTGQNPSWGIWVQWAETWA